MTTPLSDIDLAAMRAREQAATPGPWHIVERSDHLVHMVRGPEETNARVVCEVNSGVVGYLATDTRPRYKDSAFIAAARADMPALLDEVDRLRAENEHLRAIEKEAQDIAYILSALRGSSLFQKLLICIEDLATVLEVRNDDATE